MFCVSQGLTLYIKAKFSIRIRQINNGSRIPLLSYATIRCPGIDTVHQSMIAFLLQCGLDPSERRDFTSRTPLEKVLDLIKGRISDPSIRWSADSSWHDVCRLYLMYGADKNACVHRMGFLLQIS